MPRDAKNAGKIGMKDMTGATTVMTGEMIAPTAEADFQPKNIAALNVTENVSIRERIAMTTVATVSIIANAAG